METLLLRRSDVFEQLPEFDRELLYEYRHDEDLRIFRPGPSQWAFYFTVDVVRIQSGTVGWRPPWWLEIASVDELSLDDFCRYAGLGRDAGYEAIRCDRIRARRQPGPGRGGFTWRVPREELEKFV